MSIDTVFIPCAGKGTRMGELGKRLAKPLWPFFEKTLLEFQISYYNRLGFKRFIVNTHHLYKQFEEYSDKVDVLYEPMLLGSGGSLHNLKKRNPELEKILISNPDIVFDLSDSQWKDFLARAEDNDTNNTLIGLPCVAGETYNELVVEKKLLKAVKPAPNRRYLTYSGVGVVDLRSFPFVEGESSFFNSVANPRLNKTLVIEVGQRKDYWDFGTLELYVGNVLKLLDAQGDALGRKLRDMQVIDTSKSYEKDKTLYLGALKIVLDDDGSVQEVYLEK